MNLGIFGTGGFAKETLLLALDINNRSKTFDKIIFLENERFFKTNKLMGFDVKKTSEINPLDYKFVVAVGDPIIRKKIVNELSSKFNFISLISPRAYIGNVKYGKGLIVMPFVYMSENIIIGNHCQFNNRSSIGHDSICGDFVSVGPGSSIAGSNIIENNVYFGGNSSTKQSLKITNNSIIGLGAVVVKNINQAGIYIGIPAKLLKE